MNEKAVKVAGGKGSAIEILQARATRSGGAYIQSLCARCPSSRLTRGDGGGPGRECRAAASLEENRSSHRFNDHTPQQFQR